MQYLCFFAVVFFSLYGGWTLISELYNAIIAYILRRKGAEKEHYDKRRRKT